MSIEPIARIMGKVVADENGCWLWTGQKDRYGYGTMTVKGKRVKPHRVAYEAFKGAIPVGLVIDHLCRVRHCMNPDHMEVVTSQENTRRGDLAHVLRRKSKKTHCPQGHPYDEANTRIRPRGSRACRMCQRIHNQDYRRRLRAGT